MLFVLVALWIITLIILFTDFKSRSMRWAAALAFTAGVGGLSRVIVDSVIPSLMDYNVHPNILNILNNAYYICSFITQNFVPYTFFIFAISYSNLFTKKSNRILTYILLLPIVCMAFITPSVPQISTWFKIISIWVIPYILLGSTILIYSYVKERNPILKKDRAFTGLISVTPMIFVLFSNYIGAAINHYNIFRLNTIIIILLFIFFIAFGYKYGVIGIKIKFEKINQYEDTIKAINTGAGILAHSIKNELSKVSMCAYNIGDNQDAKIILKSVDHLRDIVEKINDKIQDINLQVAPTSLDKLVSESIDLIKPLLVNKRIDVKKCYSTDVTIECDKTHIKEVLLNIFKNSIEAMESSGYIEIRIYKVKKQIAVEISDSGPGIPKEYIKKVFEPFFSTKDRHLNYGLGLSYCYNIMYLHNGSLDIKSTEGIGTTIYLYFPTERRHSKWKMIERLR